MEESLVQVHSKGDAVCRVGRGAQAMAARIASGWSQCIDRREGESRQEAGQGQKTSDPYPVTTS